MLRIPAATIRNWEERYGTIVPERSPGGHRLYSRDQMEQLRFIAEEVSRGLSAADAHRLLEDQGQGGPLRRVTAGALAHGLVPPAERDGGGGIMQFFLRTEGYEVKPALWWMAEEHAESRLISRSGSDDFRRYGMSCVGAEAA